MSANPLPAATRRLLSDKPHAPAELPADLQAASSEEEDRGADTGPSVAQPLKRAIPESPPADNDSMDGGARQDSGKQCELDELLDLPGRVLQDRCSKWGYHRKGGKCGLAMKIVERPTKSRVSNGQNEGPTSPEVTNGVQDSDYVGDAPPEKKTAQSLLLAEKN